MREQNALSAACRAALVLVTSREAVKCLLGVSSCATSMVLSEIVAFWIGLSDVAFAFDNTLLAPHSKKGHSGKRLDAGR